MFSKEDFISKYRQLKDNDLFEIYQNKENYGKEAQEAVNIVIEEKGGLDAISKRLQEKKIIANEIKRIEKEALQKHKMNININLAKSTTLSDIISTAQKDEIIENKYQKIAAEIADKKIKPKTIIGSIIGGLIASVIGGLLWSLQIMYAKKIFFIFYFGLFVLCYGIIYFFTRQSKENKVVLIASIISCLLALSISHLLLMFLTA